MQPHVIPTTTARQQRRTIALAVAATLAALASVAAHAGQCPADKVVPDGKGQPMSAAEPAQGVTDTVVSSTDLAKEPVAIAGRALRARRLDIAPGGVVPWHSHGDRPAQILIASGEIVEYASTCAVPIRHKAGDITAERHPTAHWWKNHGTAPVVIYSFDLFRVEDKKNEKTM
jgi:quercetin dioxygenase-like cupin family protein